MSRSTIFTALGLLALLGGAAPYAAASHGTASVASDVHVDRAGLAKRVVVSGQCRGHGHYRLVLTNMGTGPDRQVDADLIVRGVAKRSHWGYTSEATTRFADGTAVTGVGDFGSATADRQGVINVGAATPAGVRHTFELVLSHGENSCRVSVSA
jgi:hypothetical protein